MLIKIIFRTSIFMVLVTLSACEIDNSVLPKADTNAQHMTIETANSQPGEAGIPEPPGPFFSVDILPEYCLIEGAELWAVSPNKPGNPPYSQSIYSVEWFTNGQLIGTGAHLTDCVCGNKVTVKVLNTLTGEKCNAAFLPKPCKAEMEEDEE